MVDRAWPSVREMPSGAPGHPVRGSGRGRAAAGRPVVVAGGPSSATTSTTLTPYGVDRRLPGLAGAVRDGELIVHRLGRRAVVRKADRYVKVLRPGAGAEAVHARSRVGAQIAATAGFASPSVLARTAMAGSTCPSSVASPCTRPANRWTSAQWRVAWEAWATAWPGLDSAYQVPRSPYQCTPPTTSSPDCAPGSITSARFSAVPRLQRRLTTPVRGTRRGPRGDDV